jgi:hypothetical protein
MLHLEAKRHRSGRRSYRSEGLGALGQRRAAGCVRPGILPPEVVQHIIRMTVDGLGYLLGGGGTPPLLSPMT